MLTSAVHLWLVLLVQWPFLQELGILIAGTSRYPENRGTFHEVLGGQIAATREGLSLNVSVLQIFKIFFTFLLEEANSDFKKVSVVLLNTACLSIWFPTQCCLLL